MIINKKLFLNIFLLSALFLFSIKQVFAYSCPDYVFETNLAQGANNPDVRVMQEILNLDSRTLVSYQGAGSKGHETTTFGKATREALKRFQALFIEYIGIANGKFGPLTRTSMNAVCKGPFFTQGTGNVYDVATSTIIKDNTPPEIGLAGPESANIDTAFRAYLGVNEPVKMPDPSSIIVENATIGDFRKLSSSTYSFLVTPNVDATNDITLQIEAERIEDLAGNKNTDASNELVVNLILQNATISTSTEFQLPSLTLPNLSFPTSTTPTDCSGVSSVDINDTSNPCYGRVPMTSNGQPASAEESQNMLMQMLPMLMQGLVSLLKSAGGAVGGDAVCACMPNKTTSFVPLGSTGAIPGRQISTTIPGGGGYYTGYQGPPPGICGVRIRKGLKDTCPGIPGPHNASCCGYLLDTTMQPVTGSLVGGMRSN